jgi:DNA-binding response OmpR family regulator
MPSLKCLYIDDDPGVRELVALNLVSEGIDVRLADTGIGAERLVQALRPNVIILDVMMPERDGYAVLRALKADPETSGIPVVLLTAKATDAEIWQGWQAGADYYLTKPFDPAELIGYLQMIRADKSVRPLI